MAGESENQADAGGDDKVKKQPSTKPHLGKSLLGDPPDGPCHCGSLIFWQRPDGGHLCSRCHPDPSGQPPPTITLYPIKESAPDPVACQMLAAWRPPSIQVWRRLLMKALVAGDQQAETYASWMLKDVLKEEDEYESSS